MQFKYSLVLVVLPYFKSVLFYSFIMFLYFYVNRFKRHYQFTFLCFGPFLLTSLVFYCLICGVICQNVSSSSQTDVSHSYGVNEVFSEGIYLKILSIKFQCFD